jgi:transcription elongation factor Elf1
MNDDRHDVKWSPRVPKWKLKKLYESTCTGIWDDELIDDVGMTLYMRCRDILNIHQAKSERKVTCPRCDARGQTSLIDRSGPREQPFTCSACGWSMTWRAYQRTFQRKQLNPGGAVDYFSAFVRQYEKAKTPQEKILAIDRVIHEFHYSMREDPDRPTRPAGVNLIVGKLEEVVTFLDELSGLDLPNPMRKTEQAWRTKYESTYWPQFLKDRSEQPNPCD